MDVSFDSGDGVNCYALVSYLDSPLADFLDQLRRDIVPGCTSKAHLTLLPPRPLKGDPKEAWHQIEGTLADLPSVEVSLGDVTVFPQSKVIYIEVEQGSAELQEMHGLLNRNAVAHCCPYPYHPHVTLAQEIGEERLVKSLDHLRAKWATYTGPRRFTLDRLTFVRNTAENCWKDLAAMDLLTRVRS